MATYAIGDIQGCYEPLVRLLDRVNFDQSGDTLLCVGDLVNRGPQSLEVVRLLKSLNNQCVSVLGNHDVHLLSMIYGVRRPRPSDTLDSILNAPDLTEISDWLRSRPLLYKNKELKILMAHAGIYPWWSHKQAMKHAREVELTFADESRFKKLLAKVYGNDPSKWRKSLGQTRRTRFIINAFTRMRFCSPKGHLNLTESGYLGKARKNRIPWFKIANPGLGKYRVLFGHWSALGLLNTPNYLCLDTGFVWGEHMTMAKLHPENKDQTELFVYPFS